MGFFTQFGFDFQTSRIIVVTIILLIVLIFLLLNSKEQLNISDSSSEKSSESGTAKATPNHIPQDTILKRNYLAHIRFMLETINPTRPTQAVARRQYDAFIDSELEACIEDEAHLNMLISRYDEHRKNAYLNK